MRGVSAWPGGRFDDGIADRCRPSTGTMFQMDEVPLFKMGQLSAGLASTAQAVAQHLQNWDADDLLKTSVDDIVDLLVDKGSVQCPHLLADQAWQPEPAEIASSYAEFGQRRIRQVNRLILVVPFEGESVIFTLRPDQFTLSPPHVLALKDNELHLAIDDPPNDPLAGCGGAPPPVPERPLSCARPKGFEPPTF
jgi:hypothetical protein